MINSYAKQRVERWNSQLIEKAERSLKVARARQDKGAVARLQVVVSEASERMSVSEPEWLEDLRDREDNNV
jgi:hypothetical protein